MANGNSLPRAIKLLNIKCEWFGVNVEDFVLFCVWNFLLWNRLAIDPNSRLNLYQGRAWGPMSDNKPVEKMIMDKFRKCIWSRFQGI